MPAHHDAIPPAADAGRRAGARWRVLVVDDNRDAADSMADLVELLGHAPEIARDGPSAIASARARPPDVVLCDIGLPGMDGYAVARALRALRPRPARLVAVSGHAQPEDLARAAEAGFDEHIAKPPQIEKLLRVLSEPLPARGSGAE